MRLALVPALLELQTLSPLKLLPRTLCGGKADMLPSDVRLLHLAVRSDWRRDLITGEHVSACASLAGRLRSNSPFINFSRFRQAKIGAVVGPLIERHTLLRNDDTPIRDDPPELQSLVSTSERW